MCVRNRTINNHTEEVLEWSLFCRKGGGGGEVSVQNDVPDEMRLRLPCSGRSNPRILLVILDVTALRSQSASLTV